MRETPHERCKVYYLAGTSSADAAAGFFDGREFWENQEDAWCDKPNQEIYKVLVSSVAMNVKDSE